jgi:hypothetical protein
MPEDSSIDVPSQSLPPPPRVRKSGGAKVMFVVLVVLALAGVIVYLLSLLNSKKFFLTPEGGELVVKKGIFFPVGSEIYQPKEPELANLYKPIEVPGALRNAGAVEFPDLPALNREFVKYLIGFAQEMIISDDDNRYQRGKSYLARSKRLEGLDLEQQETIRGLMADVDYIEAKRSYIGVERILEHALKMFRRAETFGTGRFADAGEWMQKIEILLEAIRATKAAGVPRAASRAVLKHGEAAPIGVQRTETAPGPASQTAVEHGEAAPVGVQRTEPTTKKPRPKPRSELKEIRSAPRSRRLPSIPPAEGI